MRQFSLGTVLRMTDKSLLRRFFESFEADVDQVPWDDVNRRNIELLQRLFDELPPPDRDGAEVVLRHVHALASEKGMESLVEAAETFHADASWNAFFISEMNLYSKALSAWLDYRDIFEYAIQFFQVDTLSWWRKRVDLPMKRHRLGRFGADAAAGGRAMWLGLFIRRTARKYRSSTAITAESTVLIPKCFASGRSKHPC